MTPPADRELALAATFVSLVDTLGEDSEVINLPEQLVRSCVDLLGAPAAGLMLDDQKGGLSVVATSSEECRLLAALQLEVNEGPGLDCVHSRAPVWCDDLHDQQARWPTFVPAALEAGFTRVTAVPMRLRDKTIGGLTLLHHASEHFSEQDRQLAQSLADVATVGILQHRAAHRWRLLAEQLQHALNSRVVIEQAKGVLAERHGLTVAQAFEALRRYSRDNNVKLTDHAMSIVRDLPPAD